MTDLVSQTPYRVIDKKIPHPHPMALRPQDLADRLGVTRRYLYDLLRHPDPARRLPAPFESGGPPSGGSRTCKHG